MTRVVARLILNGITLAAFLFVMSAASPANAQVQINCNNGDGNYMRTAGINSTFTCNEPQPPHQVTCRIGSQTCSWTCVNGGVTNLSCSMFFCTGRYGNVTCCDGSCQF